MRKKRELAEWGMALILMVLVAQLLGCVPLDKIRAVLVVSQQEGMAPLSVTFNLNQSSTGGSGGSYFLEFGDETSLVQGDNFNLAIPHVYDVPGTYIAELTVIGDEGEIDQDAVEIAVDDGLPSEGADVGDRAFDFTAPTTDGAEITLSDLRGQVVLIEFWGSWCIPCRESMPHINSLWEEFHEQGFVVLAVSTDEDAQDSVQYLQDNGYDGLSCIWEPGGKETRIKTMYDVAWIPRSIVIDKQGIVRYNGHPMSLESGVVAALLAK